MKAISIEHVRIGDERIEALVRVDPAFMRTSSQAGVADRARALLPGLARHTCDNDDGRSFVVEMRDTETAHLLEHVTCELMALAGSPRSLKAETSWDFKRDGQGVFRLALEYDDDLVALGALKHAGDIVEWLCRGGDEPDVGQMTRGLRELRGV